MSIKKIAEIAGTSTATVSRVLNNPNYKCSDTQLRDRIWRAAMDLNYVPNEAARDLKKGVRNEISRHYLLEVLLLMRSCVMAGKSPLWQLNIL